MDPAHILVWNVRGLNSSARRDAVHVMVDSSNIDIVCLQETKMSFVTREHILSMLGSEFDNNYIFLPSAGASGGILVGGDLAWGPLEQAELTLIVLQFSSGLLQVLLGG
ncbi:hypothetical protein PVAP13_1NG097272 [Panicum virgatum]|uniref:Endonuclease/exonuclease/phosphatase domain-containing protein n=1 Tax=Panicum virgatum TaxID=38727 RepID=A0A8T0WMM3_PANVG|nr:hypothetical protein PVAP13_1NG097272 [Panicum virgatum]